MFDLTSNKVKYYILIIMDGRDFNPEIYNSYLTHLGQNVLKTMINQLSQNVRGVSQGNKPQATLSQPPVGNTRSPLTFNDEAPLIINQQPFIHSIENSVESITENNTFKEYLNNDKTTSNINKTPTKRILGNCESDNYPVETEQVNWDDMFDIGMFLETNANDSQRTDDDISKPKDDLTLSIPKGNGKKLRVTKRDNNSMRQTNALSVMVVKKKKPKSKIELGNVTNVDQKIDTSVMKTVNLRKEKYTTAVKHWLNNLDNVNAIQEHNLEYIDSTKTSTDNIKICENESKNKKVIQTRLANRDGIMKYAKPRSPAIDNTKQAEIGTRIADNSLEKGKKKTRLDVQIKSNILMKDIQNTIVTLSEENYEKHFDDTVTDKMSSESAAEVTLLLVYSNGFCQLNRQYTDDTCVAHGLLMHIASCENYYFLKHSELASSDKIKYLLNQIIANSKIVCYEGKHILIYLVQQFGINIDAVKIRFLDVKIGGSLLDPDADVDSFSALQKVLSCVTDHVIVSQCPLQKAAWYSGLLQQCMVTLHETLVKESLWNLFVNMEMRLLPIVAEMERKGVQVDINVLQPMEETLLNELKAVERRCYEAAGKKIQINSALQVRNILYNELKLDSKINIKIQETVTKGVKSTSEPMLRSLISTHPLPKLILEYRHLHKAHATYLAGIAQHIRDGVVRPTWVQTAAVTGRIACSNPNLQAIPKAPFPLTLFPDHQTAHTHSNIELKFRSVYVARKGHSLLAADFQHIECRIFAHVANDRALLHMFAQGGDFFKLLASKWLDKSVAAVTAEERDRSKRMVYASLYGAGTRKLMDILDMTYDQTLSVLATFNRTFPSLKSFSGVVHARCAATGDWRATTACGRARRLPDMGRGDAAARAHAHRQALNFIIQGSGADLCKMAMIATQERLPPATGRLLLQIHDELVWEVADEDLQSAAGLIKAAMENCGRQCGMDIALPVALSHGKNWADMIPI